MKPWVVLCILTLLFFGGWAVVPKALPSDLSAFQSQALSTLGLLPVIAYLSFSRKSRGGAAPLKGSALAFVAGLLVASGNIAYYQALNSGEKATTVVPLTALYPLFTVLLAMIFLREKPNAVQAAGIGLALAAIYLFNPLAGKADAGSVAAYVVLPIVLWGAAGVVQKVATRHVSGERATLWFLAAFVPLAAGILIRDHGVQGTLTAKNWSLLALLGLLFGLGNLTLLMAYATGGKASVIAPLSGLYSIVSVPLAMVVFGERVGGREAAGVALSLAAVVALSLERQAEAVRPAEVPVR